MMEASCSLSFIEHSDMTRDRTSPSRETVKPRTPSVTAVRVVLEMRRF